ncbi:MAG TPA: hypothetical protein VKE22_10730 [Haliangiales bacterium]|nr:hypothetical protein [Haliangiales bacterium]
MTVRFLFGLGSVLALASPASATKPCPELACAPGGKFDAATCQAKSSYIVVGRMQKVAHHREPPPTAKDFAEITVQVVRWEKGEPKTKPATLVFQVGWCNNRQEPPDGAEGKTFRFYGTGDPVVSKEEGGPQYLYFVPAE